LSDDRKKTYVVPESSWPQSGTSFARSDRTETRSLVVSSHASATAERPAETGDTVPRTTEERIVAIIATR
jgi:hypothetical protein